MTLSTTKDPGKGNRLLSFLKYSPERYTVYQPLTIRFLLEQGKERNFSITENEIFFKIKSLVFNINISKSALKNNLLSLTDKTPYTWKTNLVIFDNMSNPPTWKLNQDEFDESQIEEILIECNNLIGKFHVKNVIDKDPNKEVYYIQAGEGGKWYDDFLKIDSKKIIDKNTGATLSIQTAGVNYDESANFDLNTKTSEEISKLKNSTELNLIKNIKKGDIIAIKNNNTDGIVNIGIVIKEYYFDGEIEPSLIGTDEASYMHRIGVKYLDISIPQIKDGNIRGIFRAVKTKDEILEHLRGVQEQTEYFLLRYNGKDSIPKTQEQWRDVLGEQYHFGQGVANQKAIREAGIGTKTIWFKTKNLPGIYFWGYGSVQEIRTNQEDSDWNLLYSDFKYFEQGNDSIEEQEVFLQRSNESIEQQIRDLPTYNQNNSINKITKKIYQQITGEDLTSEETALDIMSDDNYDRALKWKPNLILYGPPGTGKTYHANEIAEKQILKNIIKSDVTEKISVEQKIAQIMLENSGIQMNIEEITNKIIENEPDRDNSELLLRIENILNGDDMIDKENLFYKKYGDKKYGLDLPFEIKKSFRFVLFANKTPMYQEEIVNECKKRNLLPDAWNWNNKNGGAEFGTDKNLKEESTFLHINNKYSLRNYNYFEDTPDAKNIFIKKVTFHPSYSYEDFMEGFRPNEKDMDKIPYVLDIGIFQEICNDAKKDLGNTYVLIIDEINRGNIPKILGELITLIEKDKRKPKYSLKLTYSKKNFFVPENLIIIGTMNTADKSLMQMDDALKRRFVFEEIMPDTDLLERELKKNNVPNAEDYSKILRRINEKITGDGKNPEAMIQFRDRQIGHSYFWKLRNDDDLQKIIKYDVIPLLQDYFYGDYSKIREILGNQKDNEFSIIGKDNRTTDLVNDVSQSSKLREKLLEILQ